MLMLFFDLCSARSPTTTHVLFCGIFVHGTGKDVFFLVVLRQVTVTLIHQYIALI
jgi:hypothetical protein